MITTKKSYSDLSSNEQNKNTYSRVIWLAWAVSSLKRETQELSYPAHEGVTINCILACDLAAVNQ